MTLARQLKPEYKLGLIALIDNPLSAKELSGILGLAKRNVIEYIKIWHAEDKVRIVDWRRNETRSGGDFIPVYGLIDNPKVKDKPRPKPYTQKEKQQRYRARNRARIQARRRAAKGTASPFMNLTLANR